MSLLLSLNKGDGGGVDPSSVPYKYYKFVFTEWNDPLSWKSVSEFALYDDLGNIGGLGAGNGQLNIHGVGGLASGADWFGTEVPDLAATGAIGDPANRWSTNLTGAWWEYRFFVLPANPVLAYTIWSGNAIQKFPRDWTLQGSQDGIAYVILDAREDQTIGGIYTPSNFTIGA